MTTTTLSDQVTIRKVRPRSRPFESYAWLFMRLSGVSLILLAVGHMVMQHITHDVHQVTVGWILGQRWALLAPHVSMVQAQVLVVPGLYGVP